MSTLALHPEADALDHAGPAPLIDASITSVHSASILGAVDDEDASPRRATGFIVVILVHLLIFYALATGLGRQALEVIKKPLQATLVEEVKVPEPPPPPPPPPPPKEIVKATPPPPKAPPAFVPPPEVNVPQAAAPVISTVTNTAPTEPVVIAPAAPAAPPAPAGPVRQDIGVACPKQVAPEMPQKAIDDGVGGSVKAEVRIKAGKVTDVRIISGPRVFHAAVRAAVMRYECQATGDTEVVATQDFTFKVE